MRIDRLVTQVWHRLTARLSYRGSDEPDSSPAPPPLSVVPGPIAVVDVTGWSLAPRLIDDLAEAGITVSRRDHVLVDGQVPEHLILLLGFSASPESTGAEDVLADLSRLAYWRAAETLAPVKIVALWCVPRDDRLAASLTLDAMHGTAANASLLLMARGWPLALASTSHDPAAAVARVGECARRTLRHARGGPTVGPGFDTVESILDEIDPAAPVWILSQALQGDGWHGLGGVAACVRLHLVAGRSGARR